MKGDYRVFDPCVYCTKMDRDGSTKCPVLLEFRKFITSLRLESGIYINAMLTNCELRDPKPAE